MDHPLYPLDLLEWMMTILVVMLFLPIPFLQDPSAPKAFRLLALPAEMRNLIYEFALAHDGSRDGRSYELDQRVDILRPRQRYPGLVQASRQVRNETLLMFYSTNRVSIGILGHPLHRSPDTLLRMMRIETLGLDLLKHVQQFVFTAQPILPYRFHGQRIVYLDLVNKHVRVKFRTLSRPGCGRQIAGPPRTNDASHVAVFHAQMCDFLAKVDFTDEAKWSIPQFFAALEEAANLRSDEW
ncbi:hypothetical protein MBLNU230_g2607t1 [Neophaeotheca triangularis]